MNRFSFTIRNFDSNGSCKMGVSEYEISQVWLVPIRSEEVAK